MKWYDRIFILLAMPFALVLAMLMVVIVCGLAAVGCAVGAWKLIFRLGDEIEAL